MASADVDHCPVEIRIDHHGLGHERSAVLFVGRPVRVVEVVREHRLVPSHLTIDGPRIRVEQQLGEIIAVALLGSPRPMNAKAVPLPRPDVRQIAVGKSSSPQEGRPAFHCLAHRRGKVLHAPRPLRRVKSSFRHHHKRREEDNYFPSKLLSCCLQSLLSIDRQEKGSFCLDTKKSPLALMIF
jgi:hypothetical protein